jgi:hypothetical protein
MASGDVVLSVTSGFLERTSVEFGNFNGETEGRDSSFTIVLNQGDATINDVSYEDQITVTITGFGSGAGANSPIPEPVSGFAPLYDITIKEH